VHPVHLIVVFGAPALEVRAPTLTLIPTQTLIPYPNRLFLLLIDAAVEEPETAISLVALARCRLAPRSRPFA